MDAEKIRIEDLYPGIFSTPADEAPLVEMVSLLTPSKWLIGLPGQLENSQKENILAHIQSIRGVFELRPWRERGLSTNNDGTANMEWSRKLRLITHAAIFSSSMETENAKTLERKVYSYVANTCLIDYPVICYTNEPIAIPR